MPDVRWLAVAGCPALPTNKWAVQAILPIKEKYVFVNLTPHEIAVEVTVQDPVQIQNLTQIDGPFALLRIPPEPVSARVSTVEEVVGLSDAGGLIVCVSKHTFGQIEGLPEPKPDTIYIVSGMVRDALEGRQDVLAPDTGKTAVRGSNGQVAYVTRLRGK